MPIKWYSDIKETKHIANVYLSNYVLYSIKHAYQSYDDRIIIDNYNYTFLFYLCFPFWHSTNVDTIAKHIMVEAKPKMKEQPYI